uniref:CUB domain-containing protein n=1 Tax=Strigamia maritima TaxID=126957 RepID=T1JBM8_STRMM
MMAVRLSGAVCPTPFPDRRLSDAVCPNGRLSENFRTSTNRTNDAEKGTCNRTIQISEEVSTPEVTSANRGRSLTCWYRFHMDPQQSDWIITIRFHKFKVGRLVNATTCEGGHVQIRDGTKGSDSPGYFCGEVDRPQVYISETSHVTVKFHVRLFSDKTYISFNSRAEQRFELYPRYGQNPQLYLDRRGKLIPGTVCDRQFPDCQNCFLQSPNYPGVYPRNLRCKYYVSSNKGSLKLLVQNQEINVDGQRCEDVILCPNRPVTTQCPYDYINVYDGLSERSPLIGSFCGRGKLPYAITGSGRHLLLVFVSSPAGPFLNTGFHFTAGPFAKWAGHGATKVNDSCDAIFHRDSNIPPEQRRFYSLTTWYQPRTTCSFTMWAWHNEIIRIDFRSFRVRRPDSAILDDKGCVETLTIYDAPYADESRLLAMFCDSWSPPLPSNQDFISSGNAMFVQFHSEVGSYAGSSLEYWVQFDYFNAFTHGIPVPNTECDEVFSSPSSLDGAFSSPLNSLLFTRKSELECSYSFLADSVPYEQVLVSFDSINFTSTTQSTCSRCLDDPVDKIIIRDADGREVECICGIKIRSEHATGRVRILSTGPSLQVKLHVKREPPRSHGSLLFKGSYEFLHGPKCGPTVLDARQQGELVFPFRNDALIDNFDYEPSRVHCIWSLLVHPSRSVFLRFESVYLSDDCGIERIEVKIPSERHQYVDGNFVMVCGGGSPPDELPVIAASSLRAGRALVEFRSEDASHAASFRLVWTEFIQMEQAARTGEMPSSDDCSFVCGGSNACIPHELVCNGVRNCPSASTTSDEDSYLCQKDKDHINYLAIGLGASGGGVLATCLILIFQKCCRKHADTDPG